MVWGERRAARFPGVPTLKESGIDIVQSSPWGLAAPKGTPTPVLATLHDAFKRAMQAANFRETLTHYDMEPTYMSMEQYRRYAVSAMAREKAVLEQRQFGKGSG